MRRAVETGYSRGEETRTRILNTALSLFGTRGFDGITTREIAAAAAVPANSLRYYFGNKQGLYVACLNHTQTLALRAMEPALEEAELMLEDQETNVMRLIDAFCALQEALIDYMIGGADGGTTALFVVRHDLPSEGGSGQLTGDGMAAHRMAACFTHLMMRISGDVLDRMSALIVAGLINGQLTAIYVTRDRLAEFGWDITVERLRWLRRTIRKQTTAVLLAHRVSHGSDASVDRSD